MLKDKEIHSHQFFSVSPGAYNKASQSHRGEKTFSFYHIELFPQAKNIMMPGLFCKSCVGKHYQSEHAELPALQEKNPKTLALEVTTSVALQLHSTGSKNMQWGNMGLETGEIKTTQCLLSLK